mmetsp:Transcript_11341/g.33832  ORF Transcript_11341/g.33832 Transcript_11341/m.33832 type:complete len:283 (+) Transcript_11341:149-997(+)
MKVILALAAALAAAEPAHRVGADGHGILQPKHVLGKDGHGVKKVGGAPSVRDHAAYARWLVTSLDWGTMSTISTQDGFAGVAFGNPVSIADGGSGNPYMCVSPLDASIQDLQVNDKFTLSLSAAALKDASSSCTEGPTGDPENPPCARLTLSGTFKNLTATDEFEDAKAALNATHPAMDAWGCFDPAGGGDHGFFLAKLDIETAWLINFYGGAAIISAEDYFGAEKPAATRNGELQCPVSGESFVPADDQPSVTFNNGQKLYFCCDHCVETFKANATDYIQA